MADQRGGEQRGYADMHVALLAPGHGGDVQQRAFRLVDDDLGVAVEDASGFGGRDLAGGLYTRARGTKLFALEDVPEASLELLDRYDPEIAEDPFGYIGRAL